MDTSEIKSLLQEAEEMRAAAERLQNQGSRLAAPIYWARAQQFLMKATIETLLLVLDSLEGVVRYSAPTDPSAPIDPTDPTTWRYLLPREGADPTLT